MSYYYELQKLGIDVKKRHGWHKVRCPKCSTETRKKNRKDLSVNITTGAYKCHSGSCGFQGSAAIVRKSYKRPDRKIHSNHDIPSQLRKYLYARGFTDSTFSKMKASVDKYGNLEFGYYRDGELVNVKTLHLDHNGKRQRMSQTPGAEHILYNIDSLKGKKKAIWVEGEFDVWALVEAGLSSEYGIISIDQGSSEPGQELGDKLKCMESCAAEIDAIEEHIFCLDHDAPGQYTQSEIIRRVGEWRSWIVELPSGHKDANDVIHPSNIQEPHVLHEALRIAVRNASPVDSSGVHALDEDEMAMMLKYHENGYPTGEPFGTPEMSKYLLLSPGELTWVTGYPGHGKSEFMRFMLAVTSMNSGHKWALYAPENMPKHLLWRNLMWTYLAGNPDKVTREKYIEAMEWVGAHFVCIEPKEPISKDRIIIPDNEWINEQIRYAKLKYGINGYMKDPWNKIFHNKKRQRDDEYLAGELARESYFAKDYLGCFYVDHPNKPDFKKGEPPPPSPYNVNQGAMKHNAAWNWLTIYRPYKEAYPSDPVVFIKTSKIRNKGLSGKEGSYAIFYDMVTHQYTLKEEKWSPFQLNQKDGADKGQNRADDNQLEIDVDTASAAADDLPF